MSLQGTELLQTVPMQMAMPFLDTFKLVVKKLPFKTSEIHFSQLWHERDNKNPAHEWFRNEIKLAVQSEEK